MNIEDILRDIKSGRKKKVILDTDAYNEADDQYALAYCRMSGRIDLAAVNAAPFANARSDNDYALGEKLSYGEIKKVLSLIPTDFYIPCTQAPVHSKAHKAHRQTSFRQPHRA